MDFRTFEVEGPVEILPYRFNDDRGYFSEIFRCDKIKPYIGNCDFVQVNESLSIHLGTIRGIHFQIQPRVQGKLVRCIAGAIFDVAVDLRSGSRSFGQWVAVNLSAAKGNQLWIPGGFGHAFSTLEPRSIVSYRVTDYYSPEEDKGVAWNDPAIGIDWPESANPDTLSAKDRTQPLLNELPSYFSVEDSKCA